MANNNYMSSNLDDKVGKAAQAQAAKGTNIKLARNMVQQKSGAKGGKLSK